MTQTHDIYQEDIDAAVSWLSREYRDEIGRLAQRFPNEQAALEVSWRDLRTARWLRNEHGDLRWSLENDAEVIREVLGEALPKTDMPVDVSMLSEATIRINDAPDETVRSVDEAHTFGVGEYAPLRGQVSKVTGVFEEAATIAYECQRCGTLEHIPQNNPDERQEPHQCQGCERQGPFKINFDQSELRYLQKARLEQPPEETQGGSGAHMDVFLRDDLVKSVTAGDRVTMAGYKHLVEKDQDSALFESYVDAEAVDPEEQDYSELNISQYRDQIEELAAADDTVEQLIASLAPKIQGHETIKEAIVLQLFGGVRTDRPDGSIERGDIHVLLLGDPGTAKSTLLDFVSNLSPRSVKVSGKGATAAGITAAAVRDDWGGSEWTLEAGALVLANKGVACIDEIDKIDDTVRSSMHRAMANQEVNISKAGINATLPTRTSVLAAGNPKYGRFDPAEPITDQIDLGPTLLSRFDLQFMLRDVPNEEEDRDLAKTIVRGRQAAADHVHHGARTDDDGSVDAPVSQDVFRAYIAHARRSYQPRIVDEDVMDALSDSFASLRTMNGEGDGTTVPVTMRKLEGIQRLAEASARLRLSDTVEKEDVDRAQRLIGESMQQLGMNEDGEMDADIVEAGASMSQKDRIKTVQRVIGDAEGAIEEGDLVSQAVERGLSRDRVDHVIKKLSAQGEIYNRGDGYRLTEQ